MSVRSLHLVLDLVDLAVQLVQLIPELIQGSPKEYYIEGLFKNDVTCHVVVAF